MTVVSLAEARRIAEEEVEKALSMSGVTHPATQQRMDLAHIILDMCNRVEALQQALDERPFAEPAITQVADAFDGRVVSVAEVPAPKKRRSTKA